MKLALGTVQFGLAYGATNRSGQVSPEEAGRILALAAECGLTWLDTAAAYGNSESVLGADPQRKHFKICTKTIPLAGKDITRETLADIKAGVLRSLQRLGVERLDLLMVHHGLDLNKPGGADYLGLLKDLQAQGLVDGLGLSAYDMDEVAAARSADVVGAVQLPCNVLDQRMLTHPYLDRMLAAKVGVFARSAFLQGRLLGDVPKLPVPPEVLAFRAFAARHGLTPLEAALGFLKHRSQVQHIVVGVTRMEELREIVAAYDSAPDIDYHELAADRVELIDPRLWTLPA